MTLPLAVSHPDHKPQAHTVRRYHKDSYGGLYIVDDARECWELWNGGKGGWPPSVPLRSVAALSENPYEAS